MTNQRREACDAGRATNTLVCAKDIQKGVADPFHEKILLCSE